MDARREIIEVDLSEVTTSQELHTELSRVLEFPDFYGQNWDAFWDGITGLVEMPIRLHFHGWQNLVEQLPNDAQRLQKCLEDMIREYPEWAPEIEYL
jgi:ribonuclease inhibitor